MKLYRSAAKSRTLRALPVKLPHCSIFFAGLSLTKQYNNIQLLKQRIIR